MLNRFVMSLVPGLAVAIGVAAACAIWAPWPNELITYREDLHWASAVPDDWPEQPTRIHNVNSTGLTTVTAIASGPPRLMPVQRNVGRGAVTTQKWRQWKLFAGLPMRCMCLVREAKETVSSKARQSPPLGDLPPKNWREGLSIPNQMPLFTHRARRFLPTQPLWFGLAFNTVFWGAVIWCLWMMLRLLRAKIRHRRGRCPRCAYPIKTSTPRCSECGQQKVPETLRHWMQAIR